MSNWKNVQYKDGKMRTSEGGGGGGSSTFAGLDDVSFNNVQNGQIPKYNSTTQKWENANESGGGGTVTDVQVDGTSVVNPQTGVAEIEMPTPPTIPVEDVEVNGTSVVNAQNVAEITSYKEVTLAEYQALPSSKTSDGVMYCIKDVGGADSFPPLIYSDEEREVGVWRDGKPLYQRTLYFEYTFTEDYNISNPILNIDNVVNTKGFIHIGPDGSGEYENPWFTSPFIVSTSNFASISASKITIRIISRGWGSTKARVTLQYTKTTDTAGSGTWNQQGGYAHHYSTSEKVIGTWIDGKPLYERVFEQTILNLTANTWSATTIAQGNMKCPVNIEIVITSSSTNSVHKGMSGAFIDGYLKINSFRNLGLDTGYTAWVVLQYTKTTD